MLQHYLLAYRDALAAICRAQMNRKKRLQVSFQELFTPNNFFEEYCSETAGLQI